jgi:hypothetical protein
MRKVVGRVLEELVMDRRTGARDDPIHAHAYADGYDLPSSAFSFFGTLIRVFLLRVLLSCRRTADHLLHFANHLRLLRRL